MGNSPVDPCHIVEMQGACYLDRPHLRLHSLGMTMTDRQAFAGDPIEALSNSVKTLDA